MDSDTRKTTPARTRKIFIAGAIAASIVIAILVAPFLVDFSTFKPQIQSVVAENLNAKVDFSSARLQVLPSIGINVKGFQIENTDPTFKGTRLFSVKELIIETKLLPLLSGKVLGNIIIDGPDIIFAQRGLQNNITSLIKPSPDSGAQKKDPVPTTDNSKQEATKNNNAATLTMLKEKLLIEGIFIKSASLAIRNVESKENKDPFSIRDLNFSVTNIGLDRDIAMKMETKVEAHEEGFAATGLIVIDKKLHVTMGGKGLERVTFSGSLNYDQLMINVNNAFVKNAGIPLNLTFKGSLLPGDLNVESLALNLHNLSISAKAHLVNFDDPRITASANIANENIASLSELLPQHKNLLLNGKMHLSASVNGLPSQLGSLEAKVDLDTKLSGTDLELHLNTSGLMPLKGSFIVSSKRLDLDALLGPFLKTTGSESPKTSEASKPTSSAAPAADFALTADQKKLLMGTNAQFKVDMGEIIYKKLKLTNFKVDMNQVNLVASLKQFNMDGLGGKIAANGKIDLEQIPISFDASFKLANIHPEEALALIKPEHKNLMSGRLNLDLQARGKGTTIPTLNKTLNGQGSFKFLDGELKTKSIGAVMSDEVDKLISSLSVSTAGQSIFDAAEKLLNNPAVKALGKNPPDIQKIKSQYESVAKMKVADKSTFSRSLKDVGGRIEISDGKANITSTTHDSHGTMEFKTFIDLEMKLGGTSVFTASDATKQHLKAQSNYADLIFDDKNGLVVPMKLGGTVADPTVSIVSDGIKSTFTKKAQNLAEKEAKKAAEDFLKKLTGGDSQKAEANKKTDELKAKAKEAAQNPENQKKAKDVLKGLFSK